MSHFFTIVILPKHVTEPETIEKTITELMDPYDENKMMDPYWTDCACIGFKAWKDCHEQTEKEFGNIDEARAAFHERHNELNHRDHGEELDALWEKEVYEPRKAYEDALLKEHPLTKSPDPDCEECNGTGLTSTTYNPKSKWDWWVIGGRWGGEILRERRDDGEGGFNFGDRYHQLQHNMTTIDKVIEKEITCFAIVGPDGAWYEQGKMGWFASVRDEKEEDNWRGECTDLFEKYKGHIAVGLDCHI